MCIRDRRREEAAIEAKAFELIHYVGIGARANELARNLPYGCLLYTSDAADERFSVDLGGRRIIKKKKMR